MNHGSIQLRHADRTWRAIAQMDEHLTGNQKVLDSIPSGDCCVFPNIFNILILNM